MTAASIVNIATYKFAPLTSLKELRRELQKLTKAVQLKGTILLSTEGVNVFVAGERESIDKLITRLQTVPGLESLDIKESLSREQPFNRMLVKIKREIIAFGVDGIEPGRYTSPRITPAELKKWLDENRPVTLLDTRNDYEIQAGTFEKAVAVGVDDFRDFPKAIERLPENWKQQPVITFCTGGIRCEKAAPYLERAGFTNVLQLDGGILKYFEDCGGAHYRGECFVFDKRVAVDPSLKESELRQCFVCQAILTPADIASPTFIEGESCPHCYQTEHDAMTLRLAERHSAITKATTPLPGSIPYDNVRPLNVPERFDRLELLQCLEAMHTHLAVDEWRTASAQGRLLRRGQPVSPGDIVRGGDRLLLTMPATLEPEVATNIQVLYEDDAIVVVNKPAPLPMHPCGRFNRNTLSSILNEVYAPLRLRPAHRLDADTSGVVVFSKSREIARRLQPQFESGTVEKSYLARVFGRPVETEFECRLPLSESPAAGGVRLPDEEGQAAETQFRVLRHNDDDTSLLVVTPLTGRTNQIRAHLWSLNLPIVGDPIYLREGRLGKAQALSVDDPPLCLHAADLAFNHPQTGESVRFNALHPTWA